MCNALWSATRCVTLPDAVPEVSQSKLTIAAATYKGGVLGDEVGSVHLQDACQKLAFIPRISLLLTGAAKGVVGYSLVHKDGKVHFVVPQVTTPNRQTEANARQRTALEEYYSIELGGELCLLKQVVKVYRHCLHCYRGSSVGGEISGEPNVPQQLRGT